MKEINAEQKQWQKVVEAAMAARFQVQTGVIGTRNLIVATYDGKTIIDAFAADERRQQQALGQMIGLQCLAYGNDFTGEAALVNLEDGTLRVFGKGRKSGKLTFIQEYQGAFTIVRYNDEDSKNRRYMKIAGTADEVIVDIIVDLLKESITDTAAKKELLDFILQDAFEYANNETVEDGKMEVDFYE